jgi:hypothetical protein
VKQVFASHLFNLGLYQPERVLLAGPKLDEVHSLSTRRMISKQLGARGQGVHHLRACIRGMAKKQEKA